MSLRSKSNSEADRRSKLQLQPIWHKPKLQHTNSESISRSHSAHFLHHQHSEASQASGSGSGRRLVSWLERLNQSSSCTPLSTTSTISPFDSDDGDAMLTATPSSSTSRSSVRSPPSSLFRRPSLDTICGNEQLLSALVAYMQSTYCEESIFFIRVVCEYKGKLEAHLQQRQWCAHGELIHVEEEDAARDGDGGGTRIQHMHQMQLMLNALNMQQQQQRPRAELEASVAHDIDFQILSIFNTYIVPSSRYQVNLSYECLMSSLSKKESLNNLSLKDKYVIFDGAVSEIEKLIRASVLNNFYNSAEFAVVRQQCSSSSSSSSLALPPRSTSSKSSSSKRCFFSSFKSSSPKKTKTKNKNKRKQRRRFKSDQNAPQLQSKTPDPIATHSSARALNLYDADEESDTDNNMSSENENENDAFSLPTLCRQTRSLTSHQRTSSPASPPIKLDMSCSATSVFFGTMDCDAYRRGPCLNGTQTSSSSSSSLSVDTSPVAAVARPIRSQSDRGDAFICVDEDVVDDTCCCDVQLNDEPLLSSSKRNKYNRSKTRSPTKKMHSKKNKTQKKATKTRAVAVGDDAIRTVNKNRKLSHQKKLSKRRKSHNDSDQLCKLRQLNSEKYTLKYVQYSQYKMQV